MSPPEFSETQSGLVAAEWHQKCKRNAEAEFPMVQLERKHQNITNTEWLHWEAADRKSLACQKQGRGTQPEAFRKVRVSFKTLAQLLSTETEITALTRQNSHFYHTQGQSSSTLESWNCPLNQVIQEPRFLFSYCSAPPTPTPRILPSCPHRNKAGSLPPYLYSSLGEEKGPPKAEGRQMPLKGMTQRLTHCSHSPPSP